MNPLYERFPDTILVSGREYRIITDFREWIKMVELLDDETVSERKKAELLMQWYIETPGEIEEAVYRLGEFLRAEAIHAYHQNDSLSEGKTEEPVFSYTEDAGCIFAAFWECYGIDLEAIDYLHWWKFLILFEGLPEETEIRQKMMYRKVDLHSIKDKEERKRVKEIKKRIALHRKQRPVTDYEIGEVFS